jgi:hypothetical protein
MVDGFKVYTDGNRECFEWRADKGKKPAKAEFPFAQSLLDFLDLDMDGCVKKALPFSFRFYLRLSNLF